MSAGETSPPWAVGLQKKGTYYEGTVKDVDEILLRHKQMTVTTFGTRRSSQVHYVRVCVVYEYRSAEVVNISVGNHYPYCWLFNKGINLLLNKCIYELGSFRGVH